MVSDKTQGWSGDSFDRYMEFKYAMVEIVGGRRQVRVGGGGGRRQVRVGGGRWWWSTAGEGGRWWWQVVGERECVGVLRNCRMFYLFSKNHYKLGYEKIILPSCAVHMT
ncbi:hypothetical protein HanRHA438_Chr11g0513361 [Helianthus annuus]|nr:hypothetical protein HanRHA438_Chr11g0513361 [Helianthus annuus]